MGHAVQLELLEAATGHGGSAVAVARAMLARDKNAVKLQIGEATTNSLLPLQLVFAGQGWSSFIFDAMGCTLLLNMRSAWLHDDAVIYACPCGCRRAIGGRHP